MKRNQIAATVLLTVIVAIISPAFAKGKKKKYEFTGPTGILGNFEKKGLLVHAIEPGSPADGKLKKGDVVFGLNEGLSEAVLAAEASNGKLTLRLAGNKKVTLQLAPLGEFSPTAPYDCPKTEKLITMAADGLLLNYKAVEHTNVSLLGLMATGEKKYLDFAYEKIQVFKPITYDGISLQARARKKVKESGKGAPTVGAWRTAYDTILMAEYYALTKDAEILPALKTYTLSIVEGQDSAGLYGHKMSDPETNRAPGYGVMNNVSLASCLAMQLAKKVGIEVPGLDQAMERTLTYIEYHIDKGGFPYGFHGPRDFDFNNNGTSGMAALCMTLAGNKEGAKFFSTMSAASGGSLGRGHGSSLFSSYWTPAGVNVAGPEATQKFYSTVQKYLTPRRRWDGSFSQGYKEGHLGGVALLAFCLPRQALMITGRDADESLWLDAKQADLAINMSELHKDKSLPELITLFGHHNPVVRTKAFNEITVMVGADAKSKKTIEKAKEKKPSPKILKKLKKISDGKKAIAKEFPTLENLVSSGTEHEKIYALKCYLYGCPEGDLTNRIKTIAEILRDTKQADSVRVAATAQLTSLGADARPYFGDILKFLMEERPNDHFAEIDFQIAAAIDPLSAALEWNYYKAGFITDRNLFHQAAARLMEHKRQKPRGTGARMVRFVPKESFHFVARDLDHILKDDDKTYHTYHNARNAMEPAVQIFGDYNILEGVGYLTDYILSGGGRWSFKMMMLTNSLPRYGIHAQPVLPKIKDYKYVKVIYAQAEANGGEHRFLPRFEKMVKDIENATDGPPLVPLEESIKQSKELDNDPKP